MVEQKGEMVNVICLLSNNSNVGNEERVNVNCYNQWNSGGKEIKIKMK